MDDEGVVIKAYSGFYYVKVGEKIWECSLRGRFRVEKKTVLVGDRVRIIPRDDKRAVVDDILPRANQLVRPPIANVEQAVVVFALKEPNPNFDLLDRMLVIIETSEIKPIICFNKIDLDDPEHIKEIREIYRETGYPVLFTSAINATGVDELKELLKDKISVFAGSSGVGKSSLLNTMLPGVELKTSQVSEKIGRGRHTTRHTELLPLSLGGLVADSPGFSSLYLPEMAKEELVQYFPDLDQYAEGCKFSQCLHHKEPGCKVKEALEQNKIHPERYKHYINFLVEIASRERRY